MLAGRPHEAVGNSSPRWMIAAPRERGTEPGLQAGSPPFLPLIWDGTVTKFPRFRSCSVRATAKTASMNPAAEVFRAG
jgi:hypothetical protein